MIEFVLLFALGFLAAALVALIVAPIVQRRVVSLTERRIRASVPLSAAEIRAEKDMARAAFAAENARLSVDLKRNRDLLSESVARSARLSDDLVAIRAAKLSAEETITQRDASIRDLNAEVTERDDKITTLTGNFSDATRLAEARRQEMAKRDDQINRLGSELEELRIDLVTLDTEAENFKSQIRELRDERNALRESLKLAENAARDLENRLKSSEDRLTQNEEKLAKAITALTDRENALDRRVAEIERFRQKNRQLSEELRAARSALKKSANGTSTATDSGSGKNQQPKSKPALRAVTGLKQEPASPAEIKHSTAENPAHQQQDKPAPPSPASVEPEANGHETDVMSEDEKIDRLRARQAALVERLLKADKDRNDAALRREIATVAAMMVELTASREGKASRVNTILAGNEEPGRSGTSEPSLATRARDMISANH
ncbi:MAG: hypothetical protein ABJN75_19990 [Hoeflea sp.]|uniref:hypothetical protein n=1 Tax=Hoeflea sp. TaxID=1940281 RepID=UPI0032987E51